MTLIPSRISKMLRIAAAAMLVPGPVYAVQVNLSLGRNDILGRLGDSTFVLGIGIASDPFAALGPVQFEVGGGFELGGSGSFWAGAGPVAILPFDRYLLTLSVMPGLYNQSNGLDLGFPVEFRSRLGIAREINPHWWLGIAIEHKSNADLADSNPGVETLLATVSHRF